jgi:VWFA-related protein
MLAVRASPMRRRSILLPTLFAACAVALAGAPRQEPGAQRSSASTQARPATQPPTFRAGTNLVRVDVTVKDKHGRALTDLAAGDFVVTEDGRPQRIEAFKFVAATGQPTDDLSLPIRSAEHARAEAARDDVRVFLIFWDEYHIGQMEGAIRGRAALLDLVQHAFGPTDLVAIMDPLTPSDAIAFTRDRRELADRVMNLKGRLGVYFPPRSAVEEAQMYRMRDIEGIRSQVSRSALEATVGFLGTIKEGRKSILLVAQNLGPMGGLSDQADWQRDFIRFANTNNTAVYTLDPRSLGYPADVLRSIASETGGESIRSNSPGGQLRQMITDASAFYLLGYSSAENPADGKFHKIGVRVNRPDVTVVARRGYLAPTLTEMTRARTAAAAVPPEITEAFTPLVERPDANEGDLWVGASPGGSGPQLTVSWLPRGDAAVAAVRIRASGPGGRVFFDGVLDGSTVTFPVEPGTIDVRRTLLDAAQASLGERDVTIEAPDYGRVPLALSSPAIFRARTGIELREIEDPAHPLPPFAGREFERTDRLVIRCVVSGSRTGEASVSGRLLARNGEALAALPLTRRGGGEVETMLTMAAIARGDYLVEIAASEGDARVHALVPLRVR